MANSSFRKDRKFLVLDEKEWNTYGGGVREDLILLPEMLVQDQYGGNVSASGEEECAQVRVKA